MSEDVVGNERGEHPFSADRPVQSKADDLLGRARFSDALARAIADWRQGDSLVVALHGPWGSGKSSVKNMALESLGGVTHKPYVVEFTPWQWAGQEQLAEAFFSEIGLALGRADKSAAGKRRAAKWRLYAQQLRIGSVGFAGLRNTVAAVLVVLAAVGISSFTSDSTVRAVGVAIGALALLVAAVLRFGGDFAEGVAGLASARTEVSARSLSESKADLADALRTLDAPIVVVIDDLDRLSPDELRLMFQLVKANGDFPNLVYLLLFDRVVVEAALEEINRVSGRDFLEKIVQVSFDIPATERTRLDKILFGKLNEVLGPAAIDKRFNEERWGNLWFGGLRDHFDTLRDVNRFVATLSFHVGLFIEGDSFEVNPVDLIALETLRHFEPDLYRGISVAKPVLTQTQSSVYGPRQDEVTKAAVVELLEFVPATRKDAARELVKQLFPNIGWVFDNTTYGGAFSEGWLRELRVCHPDVFDRYFYFALPEGDISQATIDRILASVSDRNALVAELAALKAQGLLDVTLDRLEAYKEEIPIEGAVPFITALFDAGNDLSIDSGGLFGMSPAMHAVRIIHWYLRKEGDPKKRARIIGQALMDTTGLNLPVYYVSLEDGDADKRQQNPDFYLLDPDSVRELTKSCAAKIARAAEDGSLAERDGLGMILYRWREWSSDNEPKAWVESLITTDQGLVQFLNAFTSPMRAQSMGSYVGRTTWRIRPSELETFVSLDALRQRAEDVSPDVAAKPDAKRAIDALRTALRRREKGISEDAIRYSEEE